MRGATPATMGVQMHMCTLRCVRNTDKSMHKHTHAHTHNDPIMIVRLLKVYVQTQPIWLTYLSLRAIVYNYTCLTASNQATPSIKNRPSGRASLC